MYFSALHHYHDEYEYNINRNWEIAASISSFFPSWQQTLVQFCFAWYFISFFIFPLYSIFLSNIKPCLYKVGRRPNGHKAIRGNQLRPQFCLGWWHYCVQHDLKEGSDRRGSLWLIRGYRSVLPSLRYITPFDPRRLLSTSCLSPRPTFPFIHNTHLLEQSHTHTLTQRRWPFPSIMDSVSLCTWTIVLENKVPAAHLHMYIQYTHTNMQHTSSHP